MSSQAYVGLSQRTFAQAWLVFTGTRANGHKAYPGDQAADYELVTLAWPLLTPEDCQQLTNQPESNHARQQWFQQRLIRLIEYGWNHPDGPVLLTVADLAAMLGLTTVQVSLWLKQARQTTAQALPTKGYFFDQGMRPTHKADIIALYEQGLDEAEIARRSQHAQSSVGRYLRDYERVKLLLKRRIAVAQMSQLTDLQPNVVEAYVKLVAQYHPDLAPVPVSSA
ncbi:MAG: DUF1670 domain-containing protein [Anaerolineae bacterium]